jgi:amino acid transporter
MSSACETWELQSSRPLSTRESQTTEYQCFHPKLTLFSLRSLLLTSIFSAGNTYTYCAIRTLYGLALEGRAPRILTYTTKKGVPIYCFAIVMVFPILSFLQVSNSSSIVITWFANLVTAGGKSSISSFE